MTQWCNKCQSVKLFVSVFEPAIVGCGGRNVMKCTGCMFKELK